MTTVRSRSELAAFLQTAVGDYLDLEVRETGDLTGFFTGGGDVEQLTHEVRRGGYDVTRGYVGCGVQNYAWMGDQSHHALLSLVRVRRTPPPPPRPVIVDSGPYVYAAKYHDAAADNSTWLTVSGASRDEALAKARRRLPDGRSLKSLHRDDDQMRPIWENGGWLPLAFEPRAWSNIKNRLRFGEIAGGEHFYKAGGLGPQLEKVSDTHAPRVAGDDGSLIEFDPYAAVAREAHSFL